MNTVRNSFWNIPQGCRGLRVKVISYAEKVSPHPHLCSDTEVA